VKEARIEELSVLAKISTILEDIIRNKKKLDRIFRLILKEESQIGLRQIHSL